MPSCCVKFRSKSVLTALLFTVIVTARIFPQAVDYPVIFGNDWQQAEVFITENEVWMRPAFERYGISYQEGIAIIFPELIRYSALRDKMETVMLKTLYINLGNDYANFSIGVFQMKPSFAEEIREIAFVKMGRKAKHLFSPISSFRNEREYRSSIVSDLEDPKKQLNYLIAFIKICQSTFMLPEGPDKIKFLATAYNFEFTKKQEEIVQMQDAKYFNTRIYKSPDYSYSDISLFWYERNTTETGQ